MKKWIVCLFTVLFLNHFCYAQLDKKDFNTINLHKQDFQIYIKDNPFSVNKSNQPPKIETSTNKQEVVDGELDVGNHKWVETPSGSGQILSQKYYDPETKTYFRWRLNSNIIEAPSVITPNLPPVQFIPQTQLQYIQPQFLNRPTINFPSRTVNC